MFRTAGFVCLLMGMAARAAEVPRVPAMRRPASAVVVNCNAGESIQAAVDANPAPVEIQIAGTCVENVLIRDKDVTLRGRQSVSLDGIRSASAETPALTVRGSVIAAISDLSFSNSADTAVAIRGGAVMTIERCLFQNNGQVGLRVDSGANVLGSALTFSGNPNSDTNTAMAQFFCVGCDFNSDGAAAVSTRGAIVSLNDCVVTGSTGIVADETGALVDFDCTSNTAHACSINVTGQAAIGTFRGTARLLGTGSFTGQLIADDRGTVRLIGAVQRAGSSDGQPNIADALGEIIVSPLSAPTPPAQSVLLTTAATHFARVLLTDSSVLKGSIQCSGGADAFLDPTVTRLSGSSVAGCEHGSVR